MRATRRRPEAGEETSHAGPWGRGTPGRGRRRGVPGVREQQGPVEQSEEERGVAAEVGARGGSGSSWVLKAV